MPGLLRAQSIRHQHEKGRFQLSRMRQCRRCYRPGAIPRSLLVLRSDRTTRRKGYGGPTAPFGGRRGHIAVDIIRAASEASERDLASARRIVTEICPITHAPFALHYLEHARKIDVGSIEGVLSRADAIGWHPAVFFNEFGHPLHGRKLGCIVAVMSDAVTAEPTGAISRTYLAPDGTKVGKAKSLGSPAGIVRLSPDDEVTGGLFLAEGIETALSAMSIGLRPCWSTGSTAQMAKFPLLGGIEALNVIADHDQNGAGEKAAREVAERWVAAGREANLFLPKSEDLNDVLRVPP